MFKTLVAKRKKSNFRSLMSL